MQEEATLRYAGLILSHITKQVKPNIRIHLNVDSYVKQFFRSLAEKEDN